MAFASTGCVVMVSDAVSTLGFLGAFLVLLGAGFRRFRGRSEGISGVDGSSGASGFVCREVDVSDV